MLGTNRPTAPKARCRLCGEARTSPGSLATILVRMASPVSRSTCPLDGENRRSSGKTQPLTQHLTKLPHSGSPPTGVRTVPHPVGGTVPVPGRGTGGPRLRVHCNERTLRRQYGRTTPAIRWRSWQVQSMVAAGQSFRQNRMWYSVSLGLMAPHPSVMARLRCAPLDMTTWWRSEYVETNTRLVRARECIAWRWVRRSGGGPI